MKPLRSSSVLLVATALVSLLLTACFVTTSPPAPAPTQPVPTTPAPGTECQATACVPAMAMPNGKCGDGSISAVRCLRQADGRCGWEVWQCPAPPAAACIRTGCSGSVCAEPGTDIFTTCDMRPEYECYRAAACERQANGACGWTQTAALSQCVSSKSKGI